MRCRDLATHGACLATAGSRSGITALLLRLFGLASQEFCRPLAVIALRAAGSLCDYESPNHGDDCLVPMVEMVAACEASVCHEVLSALHFKYAELVPGALDVILTLIEAAALHNGRAARPERPRSWLNITGPCSWLPLDSWVLKAAGGSMMQAFVAAQNPDVESAGSVQRKVVLAALLR